MEGGKDDIKAIVDNIHIGVQDQNGGAIIHFKIKKSTPFKKLMNAYCTRQKVNMESLRFTFDGNRLRPTDCPNDHQMEDGDTLEVFQEQCGGGRIIQEISKARDDNRGDYSLHCLLLGQV